MAFAEAAGAVFMNGPNPFMVSLGIENFVTLAQAQIFYNYVAIGILFFMAAFAGSRNEARFCVFIPILAGIMSWFGWMNAPNPAQTWAVTIIAGILGIAIYMNEQNRERYGVGGPGSKIMNLTYYLVLLQVCMGIVNGMNLFAVGPSVPTQVNMCVVGNSSWGATCGANGYVDLQASVGSVSGSGGLFTDLQALGSTLTTLSMSLLKLIVSVAVSIIAFPVVVNSMIEPIFHGITTNVYYLAFLAALEVICVINLTLLLFTWFYKPLGQEPL